MNPWYVEFFASGDYHRVYGDVHQPERSRREAAAVRAALGLLPGARVLDLCCGVGRHAHPLGAVGLDRDHASLVRAARLGVPCVRADMRALALRGGAFDAVVSLFSSFGYLETDDEDERVIAEVARVLRPGGALLLDLLSREHALSGFVETQQRVEEDGTLLVERRAFDLLRSRLSVSFVLAPPDGTPPRESVGHSLRLYTLTEIARMLARHGLPLERALGGFDGQPFGLLSPRMMVLARKS